MAQTKPKKGRNNFLIDENTYSDFSAICEELGLVRSKQVELFMKDFIDEHKATLRKIKKMEE